MTAVEEAQAYLDKSSDLSALSDEEIIRNLPDEVLLQQLQEREQAARPGQPDNLNFTQALGLGLRDTGVAALHGVNAATGGFLKSAYEHPITPNPRLEAFGYTPSQEPRRFAHDRRAARDARRRRDREVRSRAWPSLAANGYYRI